MSDKKPNNKIKTISVKLGKQTPMPKPVSNETNTNSNSEKKK
jgi:hypothetical protein